MSGYHALIAPSSLDRTVKCHAWVGLSKGLPPEPDDESTLEGNAADWVVKQYAAGNEVQHGTPIPLPGNYKVDYDMIHGAKLWVAVLGYGSVSGVPVVCERIHPTDCWGEPDGWRWDAIEGILRLPDYKYGFGVIEAFENWQLIAYAAGLIDTLKLIDLEMFVEFTIVQPRAFHKDGPVRKWMVRGDKIRGLVNIAHDAAIRALPPPEYAVTLGQPKATVGTHCLHCPARLGCDAFTRATSQVLQFAGEARFINLSPDAVGASLALVEDAITLLRGKQTALATQAEAHIRAGKLVPNYHMEPTQSHLSWNEGVTADEVLAIGALLKKDLAKPRGELNSRSGPLVTPTQAIKAGIDAAVINQYASRPKGGVKLARESTSEVRKIFGDILA